MVDDRIFEYFLRHGKAAPSADNSQPWAFARDGDGFEIRYHTSRVAEKTFAADDPATLIAVGALLENLRQAAVASGISIDVHVWPEGLDNREHFASVFPSSVRSEDGMTDTFVADIMNRHTNRLSYRAKPLGGNELDGLIGLSRGTARLAWLDPAENKAMGQLVRQASEVRFRTQEVHEWLVRSLRFDEQEANSGDGLDVATLGLPPGGRQLLKFIAPWPRMAFLNRLGMFRMMALIEARPISIAPQLVAIVSPRGRDDVLDAGSLLEQLWIELNKRGLAVHPYYVISDQLNRLASGRVPEGLSVEVLRLGSACAALLRLAEGEQLQMLLRVGHPRCAPVKSRRLPDSSLVKS